MSKAKLRRADGRKLMTVSLRLTTDQFFWLSSLSQKTGADKSRIVRGSLAATYPETEELWAEAVHNSRR